MNVVAIYRIAILLAVVCAGVAIVLPTAPIHLELALEPATLEEMLPIIGGLCMLLLVLALALTAVAAVGLLRFRSWGRRMAGWTTALVLLAIAGTLGLLPVAQAMNVGLWVTAGLTWGLALLLSHTQQLRARFNR
jgi:hypothetical protein